LHGDLLCEPWPPREGGPAALEECPSSEISLLFLFWLPVGMLAAATLSMRLRAIFEKLSFMMR
jgi:hypothetical protein